MVGNYIALANRYWKLHGEEGFQPGESHLYWCLLNLFSAKGTKTDWPDSIKMTDGSWATMASVNVKTVEKIRKKLEARGLILSDGTGQGARYGRTYWLIDENGTYPETYPKNGEVHGEVNPDTSPKNGEVNAPLPPELPQQHPQEHPQKMEKFYIYIESKQETVNIETFKKYIFFDAYRFDSNVLVCWYQLLKNKKKAGPSPKPLPKAGDSFTYKSDSEKLNVPYSTWKKLYLIDGFEPHLRKLWLKLDDSERLIALTHTQQYMLSSEIQFLKSPANYLELKEFNNTIIYRNGRQNQANQTSGRIEPISGSGFGSWGGAKFTRPDERKAG